jgi:Fe-S-cluster containining protein
MNEIEEKSERRQKERMDTEHAFRFQCGPNVSCFTECCQDVTIALTPYDVLRLKKAVGMSSDAFLDRYTIIIPKKNRLIPLVILKMQEGDKRCAFVSERGCEVYQDRPWPCRMFPLDMNDDGTFSLITDETKCKGLLEESQSRVGEWLLEQGVVPYDEMNTLFSEITSPLRAQETEIENPSIEKMIFMALYNLDRFREFVFQSTFLERFEIDASRIEKIKRSDEELLKFGMDWIKFGVFGQLLFKVKPQTEDAAKNA